jgi:hypothetical protein
VGAAVLVSGVVVGLDVEHLDELHADHDLRDLVRALPAGTVRTTATHWATAGERPHVALSLELVGLSASVVVPLLAERLGALAPRWSLAVDDLAVDDLAVDDLAVDDDALGDTALRGAAVAARGAHLQRRSGRVVHFPGVEGLVGTLTAQELLDRSAVDRVRVLASGDASPDVRVRTRDHVRPFWAEGELVLLTQPAAGGTLVPFESPSPTACCVDH